MDEEIYDKIYEMTLEVINLPRIEQIKRYIELYKELREKECKS